MTVTEKLIVLALVWISTISLLIAYFQHKFKKERLVLPPEKDYRPFV